VAALIDSSGLLQVAGQLAAVQGSITVRPAAVNALMYRDATANPCAAAIAAMVPSGVGEPFPARRALTAVSA